jgi:hypothetical protein
MAGVLIFLGFGQVYAVYIVEKLAVVLGAHCAWRWDGMTGQRPKPRHTWTFSPAATGVPRPARPDQRRRSSTARPPSSSQALAGSGTAETLTRPSSVMAWPRVLSSPKYKVLLVP